MRIDKIMTRNPVWATVDTKISEVARLMEDNNCSCIPILENEKNRKPVGIITDRDIAIRGVARNSNSADLTAGEIMTSELIKVFIDADIESCYRKLRVNKIQHLPVIDTKGNLQGILTKSDLDHRNVALETARLLRVSEGYVRSSRRSEGANILL